MSFTFTLIPPSSQVSFVNVVGDSVALHLLPHQSFHQKHSSDFGNTDFTASPAWSLFSPRALCHDRDAFLPPSPSVSLSQMTSYAKYKWFSWLTSSVGCQLPPSSLSHTCSNTEAEKRAERMGKILLLQLNIDSHFRPAISQYKTTLYKHTIHTRSCPKLFPFRLFLRFSTETAVWQNKLQITNLLPREHQTELLL